MPKHLYAYTMRAQNWIIVIVVVLLLALSGMYLLGYNKNLVTTIVPTPTYHEYPSPTISIMLSATASPSALPSATIHQVALTANGFSPATITIQKGDTVIWTNKSGTTATVNSNPHPTHTDYPPLNLGSFNNGATLSLTFPNTGTYGYHNHLNPSQMGSVVVK